MRTCNKKCRELVQNRKAFVASNLSAVEIGSTYIVFSYGWYPLFVYKNGIWYENNDKYSASTSRQQSYANPYVETVKLTQKQLKELINN